MRAIRWIGVVVIAAVTALIARAQTPADAGVFFEGARLITGDGRAIERSAFLVRRGTFTTVGRQGDVAPPGGVRRIDLTGKTVMPALVDVHTHLGYRKGATFAAANFTRENLLDQLNRFAYYGVGAVASAGTDRSELTLQLRAEPAAGARVRTAWRGIAPPNAGPNPPMRDAPYGVTTDAEARAAVRELAAKHVDFVKIWVDDRNGTVPKLTPALYRATVDEAHAHGLRVAAHIATLADAKDLVRTGIDGFLHAVRDRRVDDELLALLKSRPQVFFTLTLYAPRLATYADRPAWLDDPLLRETTPQAELEQLGASFAGRTPAVVAAARADWDTLTHTVAALNAAGRARRARHRRRRRERRPAVRVHRARRVGAHGGRGSDAGPGDYGGHENGG
jgi:Amidohydrolase family